MIDARIASRRTIRVAVPCETCLHEPTCLVFTQIAEDLTLNVVEAPPELALDLRCNLFDSEETVARRVSRRRVSALRRRNKHV